jgi:hypothetical protein
MRARYGVTLLLFITVGVHNTEYEVQGEPLDTPTNGLRRRKTSVVAKDKNSSYERSTKSDNEEEMRAVTGSYADSFQSNIFRPMQTCAEQIGKSADRNGLHPGLTSSRRLEVARVVGPASYQMGIIDFQQKWNWTKRLERFFKINFKGADPYGLSAIDPESYKDR